MKLREVKRQGYTAIYNVYEEGVDYEPTEDFALLEMLARYELHDGYTLWQVGASYARNIKPSFYYVVSTTRIKAMSKFLHIAPWLSVISSIKPLNEAEASVVLNSPAKFILW